MGFYFERSLGGKSLSKSTESIRLPLKVFRIELTCDHVGVAVLAAIARQVGGLCREYLLGAERLHHLELAGEAEVALGVQAGHALDVEVGGDGGA